MDISRFGEFAILAQSRTFLDAAELLFMSQSTLSKHIMAMERELGCNLIDRSQRHVTLTAQGEALLPYAQKIATLQHRYLAAIQIAADEPLERITVGSIPIMAPYGITRTPSSISSRRTPRIPLSSSRAKAAHSSRCSCARTSTSPSSATAASSSRSLKNPLYNRPARGRYPARPSTRQAQRHRDRRPYR